jgi:hypothetical protein
MTFKKTKSSVLFPSVFQTLTSFVSGGLSGLTVFSNSSLKPSQFIAPLPFTELKQAHDPSTMKERKLPLCGTSYQPFSQAVPHQ